VNWYDTTHETNSSGRSANDATAYDALLLGSDQDALAKDYAEPPMFLDEVFSALNLDPAEDAAPEDDTAAEDDAALSLELIILDDAVEPTWWIPGTANSTPDASLPDSLPDSQEDLGEFTYPFWVDDTPF